MKKIIVLFFVISFVVIVVFWFIGARYNKKTVVKPPITTNLPSLFRGIEPGVSTENDAITLLGNPIRKDLTAGSSTLVYRSSVENQPLNVDVTKDGLVYRINEPIGSTILYDDIIKGLGSPDLILYGRFEQQGFRLFVFLHSGVAILANPETQQVKERWYFPQTDANTFRAVIAPNMSLKSTLGQQ